MHKAGSDPDVHTHTHTQKAGSDPDVHTHKRQELIEMYTHTKIHHIQRFTPSDTNTLLKVAHLGQEHLTLSGPQPNFSSDAEHHKINTGILQLG